MTFKLGASDINPTSRKWSWQAPEVVVRDQGSVGILAQPFSSSTRLVFIQNILPDFKDPMMARLVHYRTDFRRIFICSTVKDFLHT